jgi:FlaA1/EpsC-like NDP-sugar epimerase
MISGIGTMGNHFQVAGLSLPNELFLGRQEWQSTTKDYTHNLIGARILITGAAGSIGSEMAQVCTRLGESVLLLDSDEERLFRLEQSVKGSNGHVVAADMADRAQIQRIVNAFAPEVVFHLAARKHVSFTENSVRFAASTNILGTINILDACRDTPSVKIAVFASSDKAVTASNVLGITKRIGELLFFGAAISDKKCIYSAARLCNVMGSSGNVVDSFVHAAISGRSMKVYSANLSRYFISLKEASDLITLASFISSKCCLITLDAAPAITISILAARIKEFMNAKGYPADYEVMESLSESESRHESLWTNSEKATAIITDPKVFCIKPANHQAIVNRESLRNDVLESADDLDLLENLKRIVEAAR